MDAHSVDFDELEGRAKVWVGVGVWVCHGKRTSFLQNLTAGCQIGSDTYLWYFFLTLSIFSPIHKIIQLNTKFINVDIKCEKVKANKTNPVAVICGKK